MKHFFNDALTVYNHTSRDEYGRETWGSGTAVSGRFVEKTKLLYNAKGEAVMADALIHVPATTSLSVGSRVAYSGTNYRVMKLVKPKDHVNVRFIKAFLERLGDV